MRPEMTAQIIDLAVYRAERPTQAVRVRVVFDPLRAWRAWLACWGVKQT